MRRKKLAGKLRGPYNKSFQHETDQHGNQINLNDTRDTKLAL